MGVVELVGICSQVMSVFMFSEGHRMRMFNTWLLLPMLHMTVNICLHSFVFKKNSVGTERPKCKPNLLAQKCQDRSKYIWWVIVYYGDVSELL